MDELTAILTATRVMLERVQVCKRDGRLLGLPAPPPEADRAGLPYWQKLVVHTSEHDRHGREPLHGALVRALRGGARRAPPRCEGCGDTTASVPHTENASSRSAVRSRC